MASASSRPIANKGETMPLLYFQMTEKLSDHFRATGAYPEKYILSPALHDEYLRCVSLVSQAVGKSIDTTTHMGVTIEISDNTPGVMVVADGREIALRE